MNPRLSKVWLPATLIVLSIALTVSGVLFVLRAHSLNTSSAAANRAVVDSGTTKQVISQVSTGLAQVLSYDYAKPQIAQQAASRWLTGDAPGQYKVLFAQLGKLAPGQKLTLVARVVSAGVTYLRSGHAELLMFVDQQSTRASDQKSAVSAAQIRISAVKVKSSWAISELQPL